jgi:hypothetical protein
MGSSPFFGTNPNKKPSINPNKKPSVTGWFFLVELRGFEPLTF